MKKHIIASMLVVVVLIVFSGLALADFTQEEKDETLLMEEMSLSASSTLRGEDKHSDLDDC